MLYYFFFQAEDGIRDTSVTGVQTCALPISTLSSGVVRRVRPPASRRRTHASDDARGERSAGARCPGRPSLTREIGRATCREGVYVEAGGVSEEKKADAEREARHESSCA